jgi:hypothetical protein
MLTNGDPGQLCVLHRCDNRVCVNPLHLFLGTKQDNSDDKVAKGRQAWGESLGKNRLTANQVLEIRQEYKPRRSGCRGNVSDLAARYGVSASLVYHAATRRTWKQLP